MCARTPGTREQTDDPLHSTCPWPWLLGLALLELRPAREGTRHVCRADVAAIEGSRPMTVEELRAVLADLPADAVVQVYDSSWGVDSDLTDWLFVQDAERARFVLGRNDR